MFVLMAFFKFWIFLVMLFFINTVLLENKMLGFFFNFFLYHNLNRFFYKQTSNWFFQKIYINKKTREKKIIFHIYFPNTELYRKYIYKSVLRFMTKGKSWVICFLLRLKKFWKKKCLKNLYLKNSSPKRRRQKKEES